MVLASNRLFYPSLLHVLLTDVTILKELLANPNYALCGTCSDHIFQPSVYVGLLHTFPLITVLIS